MRLEDIAKLANVSKSAASLALNGKPGISEKTREHILKVAEENNYVPLRKIRKNKTPKIRVRFVACTNGDVIPEDYYRLPFFNDLLSYLSAEVSAKQHQLVTNSLPKKKLFETLSELEQNDPSDGIILLGTNLTSAHISSIAENFNNLVVLDTQSNDVNCNTITMNNFLGAHDATSHLLKMGHREIGYIKGTPRINNFYDRRRGFKHMLAKWDIGVSDLPVFYLPGMKIEIIEEKVQQFLDFANSVSAIFCEDDYIAISVIKTLNKHGINVPEDVSVVGFDDISESRVLSPELTTIHVPVIEIAKEAVQLIENGLHSDTQIKKQLLINTRLVSRESVKNLNKQQ